MFKNFDANASFGLHRSVQTALAEFLPKLGQELLNPSAVHQGGQAAKLVLDNARDEVRELVGAADEDLVIFTSGATEANNQAIIAPFLNFATTKDLDRTKFGLVTTAVEHESVTDAASRVATLGFPVSIATPLKAQSWITTDDICSVVSSNTKVVSLIHGQNEIGTLLPIAQAASKIRSIAPQAFLHSDAVQSVGRIPVSIQSLGVDAISVSAHKLGGLAGVGALVVRASAKSFVSPLLAGGAQEQRLRPGTENLLGIYAFGVAARIAQKDALRGARMAKARATLRSALLEKIPDLVIQGEFLHDSVRPEFLPNTLCITVPERSSLRGDDLVVALDLRGIGISTGSACSSGKQEGNKTLRALGYPEQAVTRSVRIAMTGEESESDVLSVADAIASVVSRSYSGSSPSVGGQVHA